jgi:hypothetical protein
MAEREEHRKNLFEDDDLDDAVAKADDTGMVANQQIIEKETLFPDQPVKPDRNEKGRSSSP